VFLPDIKVVDVYKRFGRIVALDGVNLHVRDGEYVCIIGPSGSGKSTLLKIIAGIIQPDRGDVFFDDVRVTDLPLEERGIGMVMQDILLFPHMNLWDNVTFSPLTRGYNREIIVNIGNEVMNLLKIRADKKAYPSELSRGEQQMIALARALASRPRVLLLDEPLASLDAHAARALRYELRRMVKELGLTAIHVTHNQEEALSIADRVVVMRKGKIEQVGTPLELYLMPKTPFVSRFIGGEANFLEGHVAQKYGNKAVIELRNGTRLCTYTHLPQGSHVLVAVRPEHIVLMKKTKEIHGENMLEGTIEDKNFLGACIRYVVKTKEGSLIVRMRRGVISFRIGEDVALRLDKVVIFEYPKEGLLKAIAYE